MKALNKGRQCVEELACVRGRYLGIRATNHRVQKFRISVETKNVVVFDCCWFNANLLSDLVSNTTQAC